MVVKKTYWEKITDTIWAKKNIIVLQGIKKVGNTDLYSYLDSYATRDNIRYYNCRKKKEFLTGFIPQHEIRIIFDQIDYLKNISDVMYFACAHDKKIKIMATGSEDVCEKIRSTTIDFEKIQEVWMSDQLSRRGPGAVAFSDGDVVRAFLFSKIKNIPEDALKEDINVYWVDDIQRYIWVR